MNFHSHTKSFFMSHEIVFIKKVMGFNEAMKIGKCHIHGHEKRFIGFFISISWNFYETAVGSAIYVNC